MMSLATGIWGFILLMNGYQRNGKSRKGNKSCCFLRVSLLAVLCLSGCVIAYFLCNPWDLTLNLYAEGLMNVFLKLMTLNEYNLIS